MLLTQAAQQNYNQTLNQQLDTVTTVGTSGNIVLGGSGSTLQWTGQTAQWVQSAPTIITSPHGSNMYPDNTKLVVLTVKNLESLKKLSCQVNDIGFCLDTREYWECIDPGMQGSLHNGLLSQIVSTSDQPVFRKIMITEDLQVVELIETDKVKIALNPESKELYDAFEKVLDLKIKEKIEIKKRDIAKQETLGERIHNFFHPHEPYVGVSG